MHLCVYAYNLGRSQLECVFSFQMTLRSCSYCSSCCLFSIETNFRRRLETRAKMRCAHVRAYVHLILTFFISKAHVKTDDASVEKRNKSAPLFSPRSLTARSVRQRLARKLWHHTIQTFLSPPFSFSSYDETVRLWDFILVERWKYEHELLLCAFSLKFILLIWADMTYLL